MENYGQYIVFGLLGLLVLCGIGVLIFQLYAIFSPITEEEAEEYREVPDDTLPNLTDQQLLLCCFARLFKAEGLEDDKMLDEIYGRLNKTA